MASLEGKPLTSLRSDRVSIALGGPSGAGKTTGAMSFVRNKGIYVGIEGGPEDGAGGATSLLHMKGIHDRIKLEDITVYTARSWSDLIETVRRIKRDGPKLVEGGYDTIVWDGGTAMGDLLEAALDVCVQGGSAEMKSKPMALKRDLIHNLLDEATRPSEQDDYRLLKGHLENAITVMRQFPFTNVMTFLDGPMYDLQSSTRMIGFGPDMPGRKLSPRVPAYFDAYFHCEQTKDGKFVWLTRNDPSVIGNTNQFFAKHRFGKALSEYETADGAALLKKLGVAT